MIHLFYLTGIAFLIYEISYLFNLKTEIQKLQRFRELQKIEGKVGTKWDDHSDEYKEYLTGKVWLFPFIVFVFGGLLTDQWIVFLLYIIWMYLIISPINKLVGFSPLRYVTGVVNTIVGICLTLFAILNHYHLHIDTFQLFADWFNTYWR